MTTTKTTTKKPRAPIKSKITEYKVVQMERVPTPLEEQDYINSYATEGWKLVNKSNWRYIFER